MSRDIRILLVDDHGVVRAGLKTWLEQQPGFRVVGEAARGEEACQCYERLCPDVVVMDLALPGIGGLGAVQRIRARDARARVLAFSMYDEPIYVRRALQAGALGYVTKASMASCLAEAVRRVAAGDGFLDPALRGGSCPAEHLLDCLTPREFDVFRLLARGRTPREIAAELHLGYKTVANYTTTLKQKLNIHSAAELVRLADRCRLGE